MNKTLLRDLKEEMPIRFKCPCCNCELAIIGDGRFVSVISLEVPAAQPQQRNYPTSESSDVLQGLAALTQNLIEQLAARTIEDINPEMLKEVRACAQMIKDSRI